MLRRLIMDYFLEQLYQIQMLRNSIGPAGVTFMNAVSQGLLPLLGVIPLYIYWCCDKKAGYTMAFSICVGNLTNHILKLTCCVERPWLLDKRITPPEIAIKNQGGYSFPSGHAQLAAGYLVGTAVWIRKKKVLSVMCMLAVALIAFSRVYLGVHTMLDVLVGIAEAVLLLAVFHKLVNWFWEDKKRTALLSVGLIVLAILSAVYFLLKPYPLHYDESGKLLTDPQTMITLSGVGATIGFAIGMFLERRFIRFTTDVPKKSKLFRLVVGIIVYIPIYCAGNILMPKIIGGLWGGFLFNIVLWTFSLAGYPYFFNKISVLGGESYGK